MNKKETNEQVVLENLSFFASAICSTKTSRSRPWRDILSSSEGFLMMEETSTTAENWAFLPSRTIEKAQVQEACSFYGKTPFEWLVFPGAEPSYLQTLEDEGFSSCGKLVAMCGAPQEKCEDTDFTFTKVTTSEEAALWAEIAWQGFNSIPEVPVSFVNLALGLCANKDIILMLTERNGLPVGTALISFSALSAGVYYVSTLPRERRKGAAAATMREIFRIVRGGGPIRRDYIILQATPEGLPLYTSLGFDSLFSIMLYSR